MQIVQTRLGDRESTLKRCAWRAQLNVNSKHQTNGEINTSDAASELISDYLQIETSVAEQNIMSSKLFIVFPFALNIKAPIGVPSHLMHDECDSRNRPIHTFMPNATPITGNELRNSCGVHTLDDMLIQCGSPGPKTTPDGITTHDCLNNASCECELRCIYVSLEITRINI